MISFCVAIRVERVQRAIRCHGAQNDVLPHGHHQRAPVRAENLRHPRHLVFSAQLVQRMGRLPLLRPPLGDRLRPRLRPDQHGEFPVHPLDARADGRESRHAKCARAGRGQQAGPGAGRRHQHQLGRQHH